MDLLDAESTAFWLQAATAIVCGGLIGLERALRRKPAGLRTNILVCLSTQIFVHLGVSLQGPGVDPTRVLGQVVTGVGFLGGGLIISRRGVVKGATSAALVWMLAAIGATIGLGRLIDGVLLSILTLIVLTALKRFEEAVVPPSPGDREGRHGDPDHEE